MIISFHFYQYFLYFPLTQKFGPVLIMILPALFLFFKKLLFLSPIHLTCEFAVYLLPGFSCLSSQLSSVFFPNSKEFNYILLGDDNSLRLSSATYANCQISQNHLDLSPLSDLTNILTFNHQKSSIENIARFQKNIL